MYLLIRKISPYTHADLLLGCYRSFDDALKARGLYISPYINNEQDDPWQGQAMYDVNLEQDVIILKSIPEFDIHRAAESVFIVSSTAEGFGQDVRKFHAICGSIEAAQLQSREVKKGFDFFPEYCAVDKIVIGQLLRPERPRTYKHDLEEVENLKQEKNFPELENVLLQFIEINEAQDVTFGRYYLDLADLYHAQERYADELAILTQFTSRLSNVVIERLKLQKRIHKVDKLLAARSKTLK